MARFWHNASLFHFFGLLWRKRRPRGCRCHQRRPALELLEDRITPDAGTWTALTNAAPSPNGLATMMLLTDGTVMVQGGGSTVASSAWYKLTPDSIGNYADGTWATLASMSTARLYFASNMLADGQVFVWGGGSNTGEIYDPVANAWTAIPSFPLTQVGDVPTALVNPDLVLTGYYSGPQVYWYNPYNNSWGATATKLDNDPSAEEGWVQLPNNLVLSYNVTSSVNTGTSTAQVFNQNTFQWTATSNLPVLLSSAADGYDLGPGLLMPNGNAIYIGANGNTAIYAPSSNTWMAGPVVPDGMGADDAPGAMLPTGQVIFAADQPYAKAPTDVFIYDPTSHTISSVTSVPTALSSLLATEPSRVDRMLVLPDGQLLFGDSTSTLWLYTPSGTVQPSWEPTITSITGSGLGPYTVTGTQLTGISEGAAYGDDAEMSENYPIVQLTSSSGDVYYARSSAFANDVVQTGTTSQSFIFSLPSNFPVGAYTLRVIAAGISSAGQAFQATDSSETTLTSSVNPSVTGQSVTFTATVSANGPFSSPAAPTGSVSFLDGGATLASAALSSGSATFATSALKVGDYLVSVSYGGDSNFTGSTSVVLTEAVMPASTTTTLTASANPSASGEGVMFTATVSVVAPASGTPTGKIVFLDGSTTLGMSALSGASPDTATLTTSMLSTGTHTITVDFLPTAGAFFLGQPLITAPASGSLIVADLNGDGIPDLAFVDSYYRGASEVSVMLGNGNGTFQNPQTYAAGYRAAGLVVGDVNGDGKPDLVVANPGSREWPSDTISVLLGNGNGTFQNQETFLVGQRPGDLAAGDFNGDGLADDLAIAYPYGTYVGVLMGNGNGTFQPQQTYATGYEPARLAIADFNGDGRPDLLVSNTGTRSVPGDTVSVLLGNGNGTFQAQQTSVVDGQGPVALAVGDLNGDGKPDLVVGNFYGNTLSVLLGNGDGTFRVGETVASAAYPRALAVADFSGDGKVDLVAGYAQSNTNLFLGNGNGTFQSPQSLPSSFAYTLAVADLNGDGIPDLVADNGGYVNVLLNAGSSFLSSTSTALGETVNRDASSTTVVSSANPSVFGQAVTFTATILANAPGSGTPAGTVIFKHGATTLGTVTLTSGTATLSTSALAVGTQNITVSYGGDANFTGSTSSTLKQTVNKDGTTTTVTSSANPSVFGQKVTFTVTVSAMAPGSGTPTGTVTFMDGANTLGTAGLSKTGTATLSVSSLAAGTHAIAVSYAGNANFAASTSSTLSQSVKHDSTTTILTSSADPSVFGQSVTFTATVSAASPGSGTPTGTVIFKHGATTLGTATLASGTATLITSALTVGTQSITVSYGGDANFAASASSILKQTVNKDGTMTTVISSLNPSNSGQAVTFTVTVSAGAPGSGVPGGAITFLDGGTTLGGASLNGGTATFATSKLSAGTHSITAIYAGNSLFTTSTSAVLSQTVNAVGSVAMLFSSVVAVDPLTPAPEPLVNAAEKLKSFPVFGLPRKNRRRAPPSK